MKGRVLYVNLEISEEKFQERTQDFQDVCNYDETTLSYFREVTILDRALNLDSSIKAIQQLIDECKADGFKVKLLILDPRARCIRQSENDEVTIKRFCNNVDMLLANNPSLCVVIVTHMGKDPTKGAIGHSRFSGWLDTEIKITKHPKKQNTKTIEITGRDCERTTLKLDFDYPLHYLVPEEASERQSKTEIAAEFIRKRLASGPMQEQQLRAEARTQSITDYAFHTAIRVLKDDGKIKSVKAKGQGNRKLLKLFE